MVRQLEIAIRAERPDDRTVIAELVTAAFGGDGEARLIGQLRADGDVVLSLIAEEKGRVIGHILMSRLSAPFPALALAPLAVAPDRQRSGIGSRLVEAAIEAVSKGEWRAVFVLGDIDYYERFGFGVAAAASFATPYAGPHFMARMLGTDSLPASGELVYPVAFASL